MSSVPYDCAFTPSPSYVDTNRTPTERGQLTGGEYIVKRLLDRRRLQ